jgi:hypothetical protein
LGLGGGVINSPCEPAAVGAKVEYPEFFDRTLGGENLDADDIIEVTVQAKVSRYTSLEY